MEEIIPLVHYPSTTSEHRCPSSTKRVEEGQRREKIRNTQAQIRATVGREYSRAILADEHRLFLKLTSHRMRSIGIPSPLRGRRLAGRSPYQEHRHSTGFVEEAETRIARSLWFATALEHRDDAGHRSRLVGPRCVPQDSARGRSLSLGHAHCYPPGNAHAGFYVQLPSPRHLEWRG